MDILGLVRDRIWKKYNKSSDTVKASSKSSKKVVSKKKKPVKKSSGSKS